MSRFHVWRRRIIIGVACLPVMTAGVLHKMGRSGDFGILGRWYAMAALTALGVLAWFLLEKAIARTTPEPAPMDDQRQEDDLPAA
ncbi:hypothetical protein [Actinoplanes sp. NPDC049265]|uniref:hypothetical protein n=1 Tax=Actinoplanes sp. NPDC049265 TaxID=3363902 RepID=UPI003719E503